MTKAEAVPAGTRHAASAISSKLYSSALEGRSLVSVRASSPGPFGTVGIGPRAFLGSLPGCPRGPRFPRVPRAREEGQAKGKPILFACGAHVIKVGLQPVLIDLMERGWLSGPGPQRGRDHPRFRDRLLPARTSEDVGAQIRDGRFGMARETGEFLNRAIREGATEGLGTRRSGRPDDRRLEVPASRKLSLLAAGLPAGHPGHGPRRHRHGHHPLPPGRRRRGPGSARSGISSRSAPWSSRLDGGGVYLNVGSAVILPEVFLKAVSLRPEQGRPARRLFDGGLRFQSPLPAGPRTSSAGRSGKRGGGSISSATTRS